MPALLTEPYLLDPGRGRVRVVWFTGEAGGPHVVELGDGRRIEARTAVVRVLRDDEGVRTTVFRHAAQLPGLGAQRIPYRVRSGSGASGRHTLRGAVPAGEPVRLLLTSDHQLKPMVAANIEAAASTVGMQLDGVLFAGDLVNVPDRASDWFSRPRAFFRVLGGRADAPLHGRAYRGAPLLSHAPLYPAIGNHEVMGRRPGLVSLDALFDDPAPDAWDTVAYDALFGLPRWWSRTIGDVFLVSLFVARAWRSESDTYAGSDGQFLFEPIHSGSRQHGFLAATLATPRARAARFRVVLLHHAWHGLGAHVVPPFASPVRVGTRWAYPAERDQLLHDLEPLLSTAGVHLVLAGHSHLWNRFRNAAGVHFLETSNVGNTYGAFPERGDPGGLQPLAPPLASDEVTAFSLLDSAAGVVRSWRFDTRDPACDAQLFDEFPLRGGAG